jgi:hypothetical protein
MGTAAARPGALRSCRLTVGQDSFSFNLSRAARKGKKGRFFQVSCWIVVTILVSTGFPDTVARFGPSRQEKKSTSSVAGYCGAMASGIARWLRRIAGVFRVDLIAELGNLSPQSFDATRQL